MRNARILTLTLGVGLLTSCLYDSREAKRGSVVDNEIRVGRLRLADGSPAVNARVRIYPVDHRPDTAAAPGEVFSGQTDSVGEYIFDSLPKGVYNVLGQLDSEYSYQDSLYITSTTDSVPTGILDKPGSISGIVGMQPNHDPRTALVQILGTDHYTNVDEKGRFKLSNLAEGAYTLRLTTTEPQYTALIVGIKIRVGEDDSLADTLKLIYTGIPVVTGLTATYDTLRGIVQLAWNPVTYRDLSEYQVFRDFAGTLELSKIPVGLTDDTLFEDTLMRFADGKGIFGPEDSAGSRLEYRVRVKNKSDISGLAYGKLGVEAAGPAQVRTRMQIQVDTLVWNAATQVDSFYMSARLANPTRGLEEVSWSIGSPSAVVKTRKLAGLNTGIDSLRFGWEEQGPFWVFVNVKDAAGTLWNDSLRIPGNTAPEISGSPSSQIKANLAYRFVPVTSDPDGDNLRFSVDNAPPWLKLDSGTGALEGKPTNLQIGYYKNIVIRVSDGRRTDSLLPFNLAVSANPWDLKGSGNFNPDRILVDVGVAAYDEKIITTWGYRGDNPVMVYDVQNDEWKSEKPGPVYSAISLATHTVNGKIYVIPGSDTTNAWALDPKTMEWSNIQPSKIKRYHTAGSVANGKIYLVMGDILDSSRSLNTVEEYDPLLDTWALKTPAPYTCPGVASASVGNKVYLMGGFKNENRVEMYDPENNTWTSQSPMKKSRIFAAASSANGKIYCLGGDNGAPVQSVEEYDPASDIWTLKSNMPEGLEPRGCVQSGNKIYCIGRTGQVYEYDPAWDN